MTSFSELGLAAPILEAVEAEGYAVATPIQQQAIPVVLSGADLLGIAQTGTGKTAAFALPILHQLASRPRPLQRRGCRVLVLSPTRELASQIAESFRTYGRKMRLAVAVVFGGVAHRPQIDALSRGVDVLVATPGRLLDHIAQNAVGLQDTEIFVLDEADQMLDLGFVKPIRQIVSKLPAKRQNLFFSATMPPDIARLAADLLRDPQKVAVAPEGTTVERVSQRIIFAERNRKSGILAGLLADFLMSRTIVFTRTKRGADKVADYLEAAGVSAAAIHGNKSQRQREIALESFRAGRTRVLVATDIAARGIDIDGVSHVVNYDLPEVPEAYVHRIGRTARAGASGIAVSLCDDEERDLLRAVERLTRQSIPSEDQRIPGRSRAEHRPSGENRNGRPNANRDGHRGPQNGQRRDGRPGGNGNATGDRQARHRGHGDAGRDSQNARGERGERVWSNHGSDANRGRDDRDGARGGRGGHRGEHGPATGHGRGSGQHQGNGGQRRERRADGPARPQDQGQGKSVRW